MVIIYLKMKVHIAYDSYYLYINSILSISQGRIGLVYECTYQKQLITKPLKSNKMPNMMDGAW